MKKPIIPVFLAILLVAITPVHAQMTMNTGNSFKTASAQELRTSLRTLWEDHAMYTRNVILNIIDGLPGTEPILIGVATRVPGLPIHDGIVREARTDALNSRNTDRNAVIAREVRR